MFGKSNVYAMIAAFKVRVKDAREKDRNHLVEIDLEVPLTHELADDIMPKMASDLFDAVNGEWVPKAEIEEASFALQPDTQIFEMRDHPELDTLVRIPGVNIRKVCAYKGEGNTLLLGFTATWTLGDYQKEAVLLIQRLKSGVYLTCIAQQPALPDTTAPDQGTDVTVAQDGVVESVVPRRGRRARGNLAPVPSVN
jgi:hypothetical protein